MKKIKEWLHLEEYMAGGLAKISTDLNVYKDDLYDTIKQVHEIRYQLVEFDLRLSNLEKLFKERHMERE